MTTTTAYDPEAAEQAATEALVAVGGVKREQLDEEILEADRIAGVYARHLAAGGDPTEYESPTGSDKAWRRGGSGRIIGGYEGLVVVYRTWHETRGSANPVLPFQNASEWRLLERFSESIGTPISFAAVKGFEFRYRNTDAIAKSLFNFETAGELVVRRTKVDGKVAFLVRERRPDDPEQGAYRSSALPEEAV